MKEELPWRTDPHEEGPAISRSKEERSKPRSAASTSKIEAIALGSPM